MYKRTPCGEHLVSVCTNALCAVLGGDAIFATLTARLGVGNEETAGEPGAPGSITIEHAECLAACDHAPVLQVELRVLRQPDPGQRTGSRHGAAGAASGRTRPAVPR